MSVKTHKNTTKIDCRWAIGLLFAEGIAYVTKIENYPKKCFYWESGKELLYFESKRAADDYAFGMEYVTDVIPTPDFVEVHGRAGGDDLCFRVYL